jgi:hypothetical protein
MSGRRAVVRAGSAVALRKTPPAPRDVESKAAGRALIGWYRFFRGWPGKLARTMDCIDEVSLTSVFRPCLPL